MANSFYWGEKSPLWKFEQQVGGDSGGVSGKPTQKYNWQAVQELAKQGALPVIGSSVMEFGDMEKLRGLGADAVSFGAIHLADYPVWRKLWTVFTNPCKPTNFVLREGSKS